MYIYIKMQVKNDELFLLQISLPLLPGSVSTASSTCGKPNCACKSNPPKLHGDYYRWTGFLKGKRTTITLSKEVAKECQRRIKHYRQLQRKIHSLLADALAQAPWKEERK